MGIIKIKGLNKSEIIEMKQAGKTYAEISQLAGVSRQRIQQIVSPNTKSKKQNIRQQNGICPICKNIVGKLETHHINYQTGETIVVCTACHRNIHGGIMDGSERTKIKNEKYPPQRIDRHTLCKIKAIQEHWGISSVPQAIKEIVNRVYAIYFEGETEPTNDRPGE